MNVRNTRDKRFASSLLYSNQDLKKLIIPLVLEQILSLLVGLADTIMITSVGEAAVSGVSLVDTVNVLLINLFTAFGTGGAVVAGHFLGQKNKEDAGKAAWQTVLFSAWAAIIITVVFIGFHDGLMHLMFGSVDAEVMQNAKDYLIITALSFLPLAVYNACAAMFRAMNDSKTTMWISFLMNVINIVGNAWLIYGMQMGSAGAAISTTFARTVAAVVIFAMMFNTRRVIHFKGRVTLRFQGNLIKKVLYIGVPNGMESSMFQLGKILTLSMISTYGTYAIAANAVSNTIAAFNVLPGLAVNNALLAVTAVCVGAGAYDQVRYYTTKLMRISTAALLFMTAMVVLFSNQIIGVYHLSPEASSLAVKVFCYHGIMAVLFWIPSFALPNTLRAAGDVIWPMIVGIFSMWTFRLVLSYVFGTVLGYGLMGVWVAMTVDWIFRTVFYGARFHGHKWEHAMEKKQTDISDKE